jgi:hypothetical protein
MTDVALVEPDGDRDLADPTDTDESPAVTLSESTSDQLMLTHTVRAMIMLESDLRTLLSNAEPVTAPAAEYASTTYRDLRVKLMSLLTGPILDHAADPLLGVPELPDGDSDPGSLLLRVSQATRFIGLAEAWPQMQIALRMQREQLAAASPLMGVGAGSLGAVGDPDGGGYI